MFPSHDRGGEQNVYTNVVTSDQLKYVQNLVIGDSIAYGIYSGHKNNRWWKHLSQIKEVEPWAGGGAQTSEVVAGLDEIEFISPQNAIIMIGGNDILFGVASGTWQANLNAIRTALVGFGCNVIWCFNTPRDATDITAVNTYIQTTFTSDTIIT